MDLRDPKQFESEDDSHLHSLQTLNTLFGYDDFMLSIENVLDVGCGSGLDLEWWASRTTRDEDSPEPLNIRCTGIDLFPNLRLLDRYPVQEEIRYVKYNMENPRVKAKLDETFDVLWCHDVFQYAINPLQTLRNFYNLLTPGGMLALTIPQSTNVEFHTQEFNQLDGVFYNHTIVSLIHMLAMNRFDCKGGFFKKLPNDPWISAIVYKDENDIEPLDPHTVRWYDLVDLELLPDTADKGIQRAGHLRQKDLVLPWLDKSLIDYSRQ